MMAGNGKARVAVVGLGGMGTLIAGFAIDDGHDLIGAVDIGEKVGQPLSALVEHPGVGNGVVHGSVGELISAVGKPDVALVAASIQLEEEAVIARGLLEQGINVLTLEATLFEGLGDIAEQLDAAGKQGGATILASGIQDTWWVHLPAVVAGANSKLTRVALEDKADMSLWAREEAEYEAGAGFERAAWERWRDDQLSRPPVQGGPLLELARMLGFTPGKLTHEIHAILADEPVPWPGAESTLEAGEIVGARFEVSFPTQEGTLFEGRLEFLVSADGQVNSYNSIIVDGAAKTVVQIPQMNPWVTVTLGLVRRISDVVEAAPGLARARELPPERYVQP